MITQYHNDEFHVLGYENRVYSEGIKKSASVRYKICSLKPGETRISAPNLVPKVLHETYGIILFLENNMLIKNFAPRRIRIYCDCSSLIAALRPVTFQ